VAKKRGRLSKKEDADIRALLDTATNEEIAERFNRTPEQIAKVRATRGIVEGKKEVHSLITVLHTRHYWNEIKKQLIGDEISYFEHSWADILGVFNDTNTADELLVRDLIILDIHCNRALNVKKQMTQEMGHLAESIESELEKDEQERAEDPNFAARVSTLQSRLNEMRTTMETVGREHMNLQGKKDSKFKDLKITREQRYKQIQESKKNIFELLKILDEKENKEKFGRLNALHKKSAEKLKDRFEHVHSFEDGSDDRIFLTPKSMENGYAEEKKDTGTTIKSTSDKGASDGQEIGTPQEDGEG
jgi:hypothetical protein